MRTLNSIEDIQKTFKTLVETDDYFMHLAVGKRHQLNSFYLMSELISKENGTIITLYDDNFRNEQDAITVYYEQMMGLEKISGKDFKKEN